MDYEQFLKQVAEDLKYSIPNATIEISDVVKVQGESYRGISVRMNDSPIAASMNLRGAHERLMEQIITTFFRAFTTRRLKPYHRAGDSTLISFRTTERQRRGFAWK